MRAAITGVGVVTSIGVGVEEFVNSLRSGRQNLSEFVGVPVPRGKASVGLVNEPAFDFPDRALRMAKLALGEALAQSGLKWGDESEVALILSTVTADGRSLEEMYPEFIQDGEPDGRIRQALKLFSNGTLLNSLGEHFGLYGPRMVVSNACASGNIALGIALDMLRLGRCRAAVVPGVELAKLSTVWGAERSGFVGRKLRPFHSKRDGSVLGEGAGAIIVEHPDDVAPERVLGWIEGFGCGVDIGAAAITLLDDGSGLRRGMSLALADANREPADVEYVNAHAPGTPLIDRIECQAVANLFGDHARTISVNSTKSLTTHMGAASGVVEVITTLLEMRHGFLHPHAELDEADPALAVEVIGENAIERKVTRALSNACGGGGLSTSVVVTAPHEPPARQTWAKQTAEGDVLVTGVGSVSSLGAGDASLFDPLRHPDPTGGALSDWFDVNRWYPKEMNYSYMSRAAQLGAAAGAIAIAAADFGDSYASNRVAVVSGTLLGGAPQASAVICQELMRNPNVITPNMALDHGVHLGPALVRRHFGYNGVTYTLTGSCVAGLQALLVAQDILRRERADVAVVLGHDALDEPLRHAAGWLGDCMPAGELGEGAGAVVLERSGQARGLDNGRPQSRLGVSVMMSGSLREDASRGRVVRKLADGVGGAGWDVIYLAGPAGSELTNTARELLAETGRAASIKRLQPLTRYCMAADALFAVGAATALQERALIIAGEASGSVAALCVSPAYED